MTPNAQVGDRVRITCRRLVDDDSHLKQGKARTFEFIVGGREVVPGLSSGVAEMNVGQKKRLTLAPEDAYGPIHACLLREIPRRRVPESIALYVGKRLTHFEPVSGHRERVRVVEIKPNFLVVDGNHPLAGEVIELDVMLVSIDSSSHANKGKQQFDFGGEG